MQSIEKEEEATRAVKQALQCIVVVVGFLPFEQKTPFLSFCLPIVPPADCEILVIF